MAKRKMYWGTRERMTWIPCPAINAGLGSSRWLATGGFLNGGAYQRQSTIGAKTYSFSWNPQQAEDLYELDGYFDGIHGQGPFYFVDPFAAKSNVLPGFLASPGTMAGDAPNFGGTQRVSRVLTGTNPQGYPAQSGQVTVGASFGPYKSYVLPVPPDHELHLGVHGSASGTATVQVGELGTGVVRTSLATNPYFRTSNAGFNLSGVGGIMERATDPVMGPIAQARWTSVGTSITPTLSVQSFAPSLMPVTAGATYSGSVWVNPSKAMTFRAGVTEYTSSTGTSPTYTAAVGANTVCPANTWTRVTFTRVMAAGKTHAAVSISTSAAVTQAIGDIIRVGQVLVSPGTSAVTGSYFDGNTAFARWTGTQDASSSEFMVNSVTSLATLPVSSTQRTNTVLPGGQWYAISIGGEGTLTLAGMIGQILPTGGAVKSGGFIPGRGNTGVRISSNPTVTGYSAAIENASIGMTAEFVETGAWEQ